jgi:hypothetical protein
MAKSTPAISRVRRGDGAGVAAGVAVGDALGEVEGSEDAVATASVGGGDGA